MHSSIHPLIHSSTHSNPYWASWASRFRGKDFMLLSAASELCEQQHLRTITVHHRLPWWFSGQESPCQYRRCRRSRLNPQVGKIPWRRKWQLTPVFLPGKSHGQRSVAGYSPWGRKRVGCNLATKQQ